MKSLLSGAVVVALAVLGVAGTAAADDNAFTGGELGFDANDLLIRLGARTAVAYPEVGVDAGFVRIRFPEMHGWTHLDMPGDGNAIQFARARPGASDSGVLIIRLGDMRRLPESAVRIHVTGTEAEIRIARNQLPLTSDIVAALRNAEQAQQAALAAGAAAFAEQQAAEAAAREALLAEEREIQIAAERAVIARERAAAREASEREAGEGAARETPTAEAVIAANPTIEVAPAEAEAPAAETETAEEPRRLTGSRETAAEATPAAATSGLFGTRPDGFGDASSSVPVLLLLTALLGGLYVALRFVQKKVGAGKNKKNGIQVVASHRLGAKQQLVVIRALGQDHFLSVDGGKTERLLSVPSEEIDLSAETAEGGALAFLGARNGARTAPTDTLPSSAPAAAPGVQAAQRFGAHLLNIAAQDKAQQQKTHGATSQSGEHPTASNRAASDAVAGIVRLRSKAK